MGSKRYLSPREILGDRRRDRHLTAAEILSDELDDEPDTATARPGTSERESARSKTGREPAERAGRDAPTDRRATPGADWQWLDDERVESRDD
ncbi:hypothetical protein ACFQDG_16215 [Natronoarchaeum mannanilyticum]